MKNESYNFPNAPSFSNSLKTSRGTTKFGFSITNCLSYPPCIVVKSSLLIVSIPAMLYSPYLVAFEDSMWSGFPVGTTPPDVTIAIVAFFISLTGSAGSTLSNTGISYSVTYSSPFIFLSSISIALSDPLFSAK